MKIVSILGPGRQVGGGYFESESESLIRLKKVKVVSILGPGRRRIFFQAGHIFVNR